MVISYVRRFLFVHIYKAAGMSIEQALWPYDVRAGLAGKAASEQQALLQSVGIDPAILGLQRHTSAKEIRDAVGDALFGKLFKFAFVRNPWDLQLSLYHFNRAHPEFPAHKEVTAFGNFEAFILSREPKRNVRGQQRQFIVDDRGNQLLDYIGRFENITQDFAAVCDRLGIADAALSHVNRTDHPPWQRSYTRRMFEIVREIHGIDIETFGYSPNPDDYGFTA